MLGDRTPQKLVFLETITGIDRHILPNPHEVEMVELPGLLRQVQPIHHGSNQAEADGQQESGSPPHEIPSFSAFLG
jgi:hypothetical protein